MINYLENIQFDRNGNIIALKSEYDLEVKDGINSGIYERLRFQVELMQFTGLKDKNRKDIYEGDIVRLLYTDWPSKSGTDERTLEEYLKSLSHIGVVEYRKSGFEAAFRGELGERSAYGDLNPGKHGYREVIGNIYENPELLK